MRKLIQSQFQAKTYDVRLCECYLVLLTTLVGSSSGPIRGFSHGPTFDSGISPVTSHILDSSPPQPPLSSAIVQFSDPLDVPLPVQPMDEPPELVTQKPDAPPQAAPPDITANPSLRRSTREKKPPSWLSGDTWELT